MNTDEYKRRLKEMERHLVARIKRAEANAPELADPTVSQWDDESVDDELTDEQLTEAEVDSRTLKQVQEALKRIENGTFGRCLADGRPIARKRLEAMPWAASCLKHQQLVEASTLSRIPSL